MSYMPKFNVVTGTVYNISNFSFYAKSKDDRSTMQNSGVMVETESTYFSSSKDKSPKVASWAYIGGNWGDFGDWSCFTQSAFI